MISRRLACAAIVMGLLAISTRAEIPERTLDLAREAVEKKQYDQAIEHYSQIASWLNRDPGLLIEWARVYAYANRHSDAIALFEKIAAQHPVKAKEFEKELSDQRAYLALNTARSFVKEKKYDDALREYAKIQELEKRDVGLLVEHARAYAYNNQHEESSNLFAQALKTNPANRTQIEQDAADQLAFIKLSSARALIEKKEYAAALKIYESLGKWLERDPDLILEWARVYAYVDRHSDAIALFERVANQHPGTAKGLQKELADQRAYIALTKARGLVLEKKYDDALREYAKIQELEKRDVGLLVEHARAYAYNNQHEESSNLFAQALKTNPANRAQIEQEAADQLAFIKLSSARALIEKKDYAAAIKIYESLGKWLERDSGLLLEWAKAYAYTDRNNEAQALMKKALEMGAVDDAAIRTELKDQQSFILLEQARAMVKAQDYEKAIITYELLGDWLKRDTGLLIERARAYTYANRHEEAIALFETIAEANPALREEIGRELNRQKSFTLLEQARASVEKEDYGAALAKYAQLGELINTDPGLLVEKGRVHSYAQQHKEAAAIFEKVISENPDYARELLREIGDMYTWDKDFDAALRFYREAVKLNPEDLAARLGLARALAWKREIRQAHAEYDALLRDHPDSVPALIGKADTFTLEDKLWSASRTLDRALELEPGNLDALNLKAKIMVWQGYHRKGAELYRDILDVDPENPEALDGLAHALHWDDRDTESIEVLEKLLSIRPTRLDARKLMHQIRNVKRPYVSGAASWSDDTHPRTMLTYGVLAGAVPLNWLTIEGGYSWTDIEEDDGDLQTGIDTIGITALSRIGSTVFLNLNVNSEDHDINSWRKLGGEADLEWRPFDTVRLNANYSDQAIKSIDSILNEIDRNGWQLGAKWKPNRLIAASIDADWLDYSDSNRREHILADLEYRIKQSPYTKIYYNYYDLEYSKDGEGYFAPADFYSHTIGLYISQRISLKWFISGQAAMGREHHDEGDWVSSAYQAAELAYRPGLQWSCKLRATHFWSDDDADAGLEGYEKTYISIAVSRSLGSTAFEDDRYQPVPSAAVPENR